MRFLSLLLLPTGEPFDESLVSPAELDPDKLRVFRVLFSAPAMQGPTPIPGMESLSVQCTSSMQGMALGTIWLGDKVLVSTVMLAGRNPAAEMRILEMFYDSVSRTPVVTELSADPSPFADFLVREERPACFGVLWPIITHAAYQPFAWADIYLAAAFFQAIGIERNA
jgi:hypothetical protein